MPKTQEELRREALTAIITEELKSISKDTFFGKLIFEIRNGVVYQVRVEQTKDVADAVRMLKPPATAESSL